MTLRATAKGAPGECGHQLNPGRPTSERGSRAQAWIVGASSTVTNELLAHALRGRGLETRLVPPTGLNAAARCGDVVLGRVDVRQTLDGIEDGIWELRRAERRSLRVLNPAPSLVACHDKLETVIRLARVGVPEPRTAHVDLETKVKAIERVAAPGEWRTNVALGASRRPVAEVPPKAALLALSAASALKADLVGVDLLPLGPSGYVVLEVNGAVDFTPDYSLDGFDVFDAAAGALLSNIAAEDVESAGLSG